MLRGRRVLIVDDEPDIVASIKTTLRLSFPDVEVTTVPSAEDAQRELARAPFDALIVDHKLPGVTGIEFMRDLEARRVRVPRILVTGFQDQDVVEAAVNELHVEAFLHKPFRKEALEDAVRRALASSGFKRIPPVG